MSEKSFGGKVKVQSDLSNYATKVDLKSTFNHLFAKKTDLANLKSDADKLDIDKLNKVKGEIHNITKLAIDAFLNAKINEVKGEMDNITNLATTSALNTVEHSVSQKNDYNTKINETEKKITEHNHDKYIIIKELNTFMAEISDLRLKRANKTNFDNKLRCYIK